MADPRSEWLLTTMNAVRELMTAKLGRHTLDAESEREMQMALEEIEVMWEELAGRTQLLDLEQQRFRDFFEFAPDAYAITDGHCTIREANHSLADLLEHPRGDEHAGHHHEQTGGDDLHALRAGLGGVEPGKSAVGHRPHAGSIAEPARRFIALLFSGDRGRSAMSVGAHDRKRADALMPQPLR